MTRSPSWSASGHSPTTDLTADERIDRDLALAMLRGRLIVAEWQGWKRDPLTYSGPALNGIFLLFLHRLRPDQDLVDAAVSRLAQVPTVFAQGRANLDPALAHPLIVERALASAKAGARYVRELLPAEVQDVELSERLRSAGVAAARAFDDWALFLEGFAPDRARDLGLRRGALQPNAPGTRGTGLRRTRPAGAWPARARPARCRDGGPRGAHRRDPRLARGHRAVGPGPPADGRGDAPGLRGLDRAGPRLPGRRAAWSACPTARSAWSSRLRCSSGRCWGWRRTWRRRRSATRSRGTSSCPSRPTARSADEVDKRLSSNSHGGHPDHLGPRGVSRATTGTWSCAASTPRGCGGCSRRPTSTRAGRSTRSG